MTFEGLLDALSALGLDALEGFSRDAALAAGISPATVRKWGRLHEVYFAPTSYSNKQRLALDKARTRGFTLEQLALVEELLAKVSGKSKQWALRLKILSQRGTFNSLKARVKKLLGIKPAPPKAGVRFGRSVLGMRAMLVMGPERDMANLEHFLRQGLNPDRPAGPQMLARFLTYMYDGRGLGVAADAASPLILVPIDEHLRILAGDGDDTVLGLTDGTTITGAEYLRRYHGQKLQVALFHPTEGPVNLYRGERYANEKQRVLASAVSPACLFPGCRHGADNCQMHHIRAWSRGGETNIDNLAPLCSYHNRVNDDDPGRRSRGHIAKVRGRPVWVSPRGRPVPNAGHPKGAMELLF